jgi:hypothetical protein
MSGMPERKAAGADFAPAAGILTKEFFLFRLSPRRTGMALRNASDY